MKRKFLFLTIIGLTLILPLQQAQAIAPLVGAGVAAAIAVVGGWVLHLISFMTAGLVAAASATLHYVLYSLPFKYTSGGIVDVGWPIIRDLTNMLFVIILVFIGLSVALRLRDYGAKKTLVPLVIIALLINFTPVIIGLIIDASNIVMNFFLQDLNPGAYWESHLAIQKAIMPSGWELLNPLKHMENTLAALILIVMDLIVFAVLSMYALLFLTRYLAIWVLVILSPLAFACYILPATKKYWSQWWDQLFQWCIIGMVGAFFLYLGSHLFKWLESLNFSATGPSIGVELSTKLIPLVMIIIFYFIGIMVAFSTSAIGAKQITAGFKRGYKAAGKTAAFKTWAGYTTATKAVTAGVKRARKTYAAGKIMGLPTRIALGEAIKRGWERKIGPVIGPKAATKGTLKAIGDVAKTGALAGLGIKLPKKKKGEPCPQCKKPLPNNADYCPNCGFKF